MSDQVDDRTGATQIVVWEATAEDWQLWRELRLAALAEAPLAFGSTYEREYAFDEPFWRARLADPQNTNLCAERDGQPVGIAGGYLRDDERGANGVIAELVSMWVRPEARGLGIASALIEEVCGWARGRGQDEIRLFVADGNDLVRAIYVHLGFALNGYRQPLPRDASREELEMVRLLATPSR